MPKFKIEPNPTFPETVFFRLPGGKTASIRVDYKYMDAEAYAQHFADMKGKIDPEIAASIAVGWDAEDEFGEEALARLFKAYPVAARAYFRTFREAVFGAEEKN